MKCVNAGLVAMTLTLGLAMVSEQASAGSAWLIKKEQWSEVDEKNFSDFVQSIYDSGCSSVSSCMKGSGNPYRSRDPQGISWYADCGRFPYLLRSYFAFHNNLPFQGATDVRMRDPNDSNPILQYTARGNVVTNRDFVTSGEDGYAFIRHAVEAVYTAVYRVDSRLDIPSGGYGDTYHVKISRQYIRPGTIVYDPNGHIATVANISREGKVTLLDSHPDNSVSRVPYTGAFQATSPSQSGGFKNWRPIRLVGATTGPDNVLRGGRISVKENGDTPGFSMEQFVGDQPNPSGTFADAKWSTQDGVMNSRQFVAMVRARLSEGAVTYDILKEVNEDASTLCLMVQDRMKAVQAAISRGIDQKSMDALPMNIYGTTGEWEEYSTPSRDARLKTATAEYYQHVAKMVELYKKGDKRVIYSGSDLAKDMLRSFDKAVASCDLSYVKSNGQTKDLSLNDAILRMYKMSFDPYHCVELRWGASSEEELSSCDSDSEKRAWYKAEQRLRNSLDRKYDKKMGWNLDELQNRGDMVEGSAAQSVGSDTQVPLDVRSYILNLKL